MTEKKLALGITVKRNGVLYLTTNYQSDNGYVSVVCIENTNQKGQTYQLAVNECVIHDDVVHVANLSDKQWSITKVQTGLVEQAEAKDLMIGLSVRQLENSSFFFPKVIQEKVFASSEQPFISTADKPELQAALLKEINSLVGEECFDLALISAPTKTTCSL